MKRQTYWFTREPKGHAYSVLLETALTECSALGLIVQTWRQHLPESFVDALRSLEPQLIEVAEVQEWPGSKLSASTSLVHERHLYRYDLSTKIVMERLGKGLYDWENPKLPDDPHLLRSGLRLAWQHGP